MGSWGGVARLQNKPVVTTSVNWGKEQAAEGRRTLGFARCKAGNQKSVVGERVEYGTMNEKNTARRKRGKKDLRESSGNDTDQSLRQETIPGTTLTRVSPDRKVESYLCARVRELQMRVGGIEGVGGAFKASRKGRKKVSKEDKGLKGFPRLNKRNVFCGRGLLHLWEWQRFHLELYESYRSGKRGRELGNDAV